MQKWLPIVKNLQFWANFNKNLELSYWKSTKIFVFCKKSCGSKFWIFFKKFQNFEIFLEFDFLVFWYIFMYFVTYGRKYWADIMFWISWFCSLLLVKWPIFGQLFGLISQKATTGWFSFWLFSTYLCMYFMKLKWFFMVHDLFETEASQPLCNKFGLNQNHYWNKPEFGP